MISPDTLPLIKRKPKLNKKVLFLCLTVIACQRVNKFRNVLKGQKSNFYVIRQSLSGTLISLLESSQRLFHEISKELTAMHFSSVMGLSSLIELRTLSCFSLGFLKKETGLSIKIFKLKYLKVVLKKFKKIAPIEKIQTTVI